MKLAILIAIIHLFTVCLFGICMYYYLGPTEGSVVAYWRFFELADYPVHLVNEKTNKQLFSIIPEILFERVYEFAPTEIKQLHNGYEFFRDLFVKPWILFGVLGSVQYWLIVIMFKSRKAWIPF